MKWIIVGLGNPGAEYEATRHNAGRIALEHIRLAWGFPDWEYKKIFDALVSKGAVAGSDVLLVLPETYMNESGRSVAKFVKSGAQAEQLVVLHDDADLPTGAVKTSFGRGAGGQNGVRSIAGAIGTKDFYRFRLGIAPKRPEGAPHVKAGEYVLKKFSPTEQALLQKRALTIGERITFLLEHGHKAFKDTITQVIPAD